MADDNLLDSIQVIGDGIGAINHRLANTLPTEPGFSQLEKERDEALDRLHVLIKVFTANSTLRFIKADSDLANVNSEMKKVLDEIKSLVETVQTVTRFVAAIDTLIGQISKVL